MKTVISHPYCFSPFYNFSHFYRRGGDYNRCDSSFGFSATLLFRVSCVFFFRQWFSPFFLLSYFWLFSPRRNSFRFLHFIKENASFLFFRLKNRGNCSLFRPNETNRKESELKIKPRNDLVEAIVPLDRAARIITSHRPPIISSGNYTILTPQAKETFVL